MDRCNGQKRGKSSQLDWAGAAHLPVLVCTLALSLPSMPSTYLSDAFSQIVMRFRCLFQDDLRCRRRLLPRHSSLLSPRDLLLTSQVQQRRCNGRAKQDHLSLGSEALFRHQSRHLKSQMVVDRKERTAISATSSVACCCQSVVRSCSVHLLSDCRRRQKERKRSRVPAPNS